jgi:DNA mismatch endonuclease, patch repair protein
MEVPSGSWASSVAARATMQANRSRDTKPEMVLRRAAHALGLRYRVSVRPLPWFRRTADLVFTRVRLAVFIDGCFWHGCPQHHTKSKANGEFWSAKVHRNRERDVETTAVLREHGWTVMRFWEHDDLTVAAQQVAEVVHRLRAATATQAKSSQEDP